jgi:exoribonuclease R
MSILKTKDYNTFHIGDVEIVGARLMNTALPGDTVRVFSPSHVEIVERADHSRIVGILELTAKVRFGMTSRGASICRFSPFSESYPPFYVGCSQKDVSQNMLAVIEFSEWKGSTCPRGTLVQMFGPAGDLAAEEEALAFHASPLRWKKLEALVEPPLLNNQVRGNTFHVDPPGCKDIDDAITLTPMEGGKTRVQIHIADVASWLTANPFLAEKASRISQTLYRDGEAIRPMFPAELSEDAFSLLPGAARRVLTLSFIWDKVPTEFVWSHDMIRVSQGFTYYSVTKSIFANDLEAICSGLAGRRVTDSHEWIEQLMLLYNREAAKMLRAAGRGVLRRHKGRDEERFSAYAALGLPAERLATAAGEYCHASAAETRHWGLGQDVYCHASSPIRRWADCVNQMVLLQIVSGSEVVASPADVDYMNARSKAFKGYERDITFARAVIGAEKKEVDGIVADTGCVWVAAWGRIVKMDTGANASGTPVRIKFFCDATQRNWKRRMVLAPV